MLLSTGATGTACSRQPGASRSPTSPPLHPGRHERLSVDAVLVGVSTILSFVIGTWPGSSSSRGAATWLEASLPISTFFSAIPTSGSPSSFLLFAVVVQCSALGWLRSDGTIVGTPPFCLGLRSRHPPRLHHRRPLRSRAGCWHAEHDDRDAHEDYIIWRRRKGSPRRDQLRVRRPQRHLPSLASFALSLGLS